MARPVKSSDSDAVAVDPPKDTVKVQVEDEAPRYVEYISKYPECNGFPVVAANKKWIGGRNPADEFVRWTVPAEDAELFEATFHFQHSRIIRVA